MTRTTIRLRAACAAAVTVLALGGIAACSHDGKPTPPPTTTPAPTKTTRPPTTPPTKPPTTWPTPPVTTPPTPTDTTTPPDGTGG